MDHRSWSADLFRAFRRIALAGTVVLAVGPLAVTANGETSKQVGNSYVLYISDDKTNAVLVGAPVRTAAEKRLRNADADALKAGVRLAAAPLSTTHAMSGNGYATGPDGDIHSVQNWFNTTIVDDACPFSWSPCRATLSGDSHGRWWGCNPNCNADSQYLRETVKEDGWSVAVSAGGPGFSGSGDTAIWDTTFGSGWAVDHYWNNLVFTTWVGYYGWEQWGRYDAVFGGRAYTANSYGAYWCGC
jgi:hypothetical protein